MNLPPPTWNSVISFALDTRHIPLNKWISYYIDISYIDTFLSYNLLWFLIILSILSDAFCINFIIIMIIIIITSPTILQWPANLLQIFQLLPLECFVQPINCRHFSDFVNPFYLKSSFLVILHHWATFIICLYFI